mmetsp:Transcript_2664/g.4058  ORF Transcript_2664/g.4058 Transcript_2664/m.4058 type:complete len:125 (-) Transcript_2664:38-412(-)
MTGRAVKFATTSVDTYNYNVDVERNSLLWYKSADLKQFKEDRIIDVIKIMNREQTENDEKICWWGLERLIVPSVRSKTRLAREQVKQVVLRKQDGACSDRVLKEASSWAAATAQKRATYYSLHL